MVWYVVVMEKDQFLYGHQEMEAVTLTIATAMDTQIPYSPCLYLQQLKEVIDLGTWKNVPLLWPQLIVQGPLTVTAALSPLTKMQDSDLNTCVLQK